MQLDILCHYLYELDVLFSYLSVDLLIHMRFVELLRSNKVRVMLDVHVIRIDAVIRTSPDGWVDFVHTCVCVMQLYKTGEHR